MNFAKIKGYRVIKYPYMWGDLREQNPHTKFDARLSLKDLYARTEDAWATGSEIVDVVFTDPPNFDKATEGIVCKTAPELIDGVWTIGWDIVERPPVVEGTTNEDGASSE